MKKKGLNNKEIVRLVCDIIIDTEDGKLSWAKSEASNCYVCSAVGYNIEIWKVGKKYEIVTSKGLRAISQVSRFKAGGDYDLARVFKELWNAAEVSSADMWINSVVKLAEFAH